MGTMCIYHGNCADGFAAAWVVRLVYPNAIFHAGTYGNKPPDVTGLDVIVVDFSFKRDTIIEMAKVAKSILILDHHKTAQSDLVDLPENVTVVFDMERSGCRITWDYYFPGTQAPKLLYHIEDRDLWRFALPRTRAIQACVFSYPYDFDQWTKLFDTPIQNLASDGEAIERKHHKDVAELVNVCKRRMVIGGVEVWAVNIPYTLTSDAGDLMCNGGEPFAACYWDTPEWRVFSLRSREDGADVSEIAKTYGGGGHKHASGFRLPHGVAP